MAERRFARGRVFGGLRPVSGTGIPGQGGEPFVAQRAILFLADAVRRDMMRFSACLSRRAAFRIMNSVCSSDRFGRAGGVLLFGHRAVKRSATIRSETNAGRLGARAALHGAFARCIAGAFR
ncbi:MAG: hypothetical protein D6725_10210 [Planctomycetota bacterium]|nr:MAG: hypothetical protein D6725_10210 [Planctomycetota bacterium]